MSDARLVRLVELKLLGTPRAQIAQELGVHETRVWQLTQTPLYKQLWDEAVGKAKQAVTEKLVARAEDAADTVYHLMQRGQHERVRLLAAQDLLDRAGFGTKRDATPGVVVHIDGNTVKLMVGVARELGVGTPF